MPRKIGLLITLTKQYQERILTSLLVKYGIDEFNGPQGRILYGHLYLFEDKLR